ncbi:MAG: GntR family transcriptional regulator [Alphaproteobacteria bacterium]|nr:GntR family transcriptional regulator [Alphaproteobacteria bacterium]
MQPIPRSSLRQQVYAQLREGIRAGRFQPSDRLREEDIAATLQVSRTPVREALSQLASEGLLEPRAKGGYVLPEITPDDVAEIFELRLLLEPHAARRAATELSDSDLAALERTLASEGIAHRDGEIAAFIAANAEFRRILFGTIGRRLRQCIVNFDDHVQSIRLLTLHDPATQRIVMSGQQRLLAALRARDPDAAEQAMRTHDLAARHCIEAHFVERTADASSFRR